MTARSRTLDKRVSLTGSLYWITWRYNSQNLGMIKYCDDHIGNWEVCNPLSITEWTKVSPCLNGTLKNTQGAVLRKFTSYPLAYWTNAIPDPRTKFSQPSTADLNNYAWEILAKTNVSQAYVNVLQQVGELKDLPDLVRGWGNSLLESAAKGVISWRWCLKPMAGDVTKLLNFVGACNKRFEELRRLRDGKVIRKRVMLGSDQKADTPSRVLLHSEGASVYGTRTNVYTRKVWGTANWKVGADSDIPDMDDRELLAKTRRLMLGLNTHGALEAAWELVPWSWLVDWFSNCGTMLAATNNSVGCTWHRLSLMQTSTTEVRFEVLPTDYPSWVTVDGTWDWKCVRKERYPVFPVVPFPLPSLPVLSLGKVSILASLAVLMGNKPKR